MRFLLTIVIWIVIIGGLFFYSRQREIAEARVQIQSPEIIEAKDAYTLQVTPTFSIEKDPFALQIEEDTASGAKLNLNGAPLPVTAENLQRGIPWTLEGVEGLVVGNNEIYVQASPPLTESNLEHGVRVQLLESGTVIVDRTIWSNQGALVSGTIHFQLKEDAHEDHAH